MTAEEFEALPRDFRAEIVDGVVQPMTWPALYHQNLVSKIATALDASAPPDLCVVRQLPIRFRAEPVPERLPDVVAAQREGLNPFATELRPDQVVLVVGVVGPNSETIDRLHKPAEYAASRIPFFWLVEVQPALTVHTFQHDEGVYRRVEVFGPTAVISVPGLEWAQVPVADLIPRV